MIRARGLTVSYDGGPVLAGVDLAVAAGELVVVVGEDGCGTSTLLRVLAGLQPAAGTVEGGPTALLEQPPGGDWRDGDVAGDLAGGALLAALGAGALTEREMETLSGGERQRVRLARVLGDPAPVLLLDEPVGYLDGAGVRTALEVLRQHTAAGRAVLAVAKLDERVAAAADRVLVLRAGRLDTPA